LDTNMLESRVITQIGVVVKDIEKTTEAYAQFFKVENPKIILTDTVERSNLTYNGKVSSARAKLASFHMGSVQLDLIEPDEHPSIWRTFLEEKGEGILHIAFVVNGLKEKTSLMEKRGMPPIHQADFKGGRYAYFDTLDSLKIVLELMEFDL
jgi:methylmalonyl-CoA/ethylmalonyl-CoA epimerase